jgi:ankyrin repeat protein
VKGADINMMTRKSEMTCLHWVSFHNDLESIEYLLDNGVAIVKDNRGRTPLDIAA